MFTVNGDGSGDTGSGETGSGENVKEKHSTLNNDELFTLNKK